MTTTSPEDQLLYIESDPGPWLTVLFPTYVTAPFSPHQTDFWLWLWSIRPRTRPQPFIAIWPRGGAKSTSAELACVALGSRGVRRYGVYVTESQAQADDHVANVAEMLERRDFAPWYPDMAERALTKYGQARGWRRNRLHTRSGFILDALGLDVASRGMKVDEARPDFLVFDDLDSDTDSLDAVERKISTLTRRILPALAPHAAILGIQNLVHRDSIFSRIADGRVDFLADRILSGPIPAVRDLTYATHTEPDGRPRVIITGGTPSWEGMPLPICQESIDTFGITAFLSEAQHVTPELTGGMYDHVQFRHVAPDAIPALDKIVCWLDPAVTDTDESDSQAIQIDGISRDRTLYRLWSWEERSSPQFALQMAFLRALEYGAIYIGIETDQGGDTWNSVFREVRSSLGSNYSHIRMRSAKAGQGHGSKVHRSSQMLSEYERGLIVHVEGTHHVLERALRRFPRVKPHDLTDVCYWGWWDLRRLSRPASATSAARVQLPDAARSPGRVVSLPARRPGRVFIP